MALRRRQKRAMVVVEQEPPGKQAFGFAEFNGIRKSYKVGEVAPLEDAELRTVSQPYHGCGDCENAFDELKSQWA